METALCVKGGWCSRPVPIPHTDVAKLDAGLYGEITFVHVTMQKIWLLQVCSPCNRPTAGQLKGSNAWLIVRRAWAKAGGAAVADDADECDTEGDSDVTPDPMTILLRANAVETPTKKTPKDRDDPSEEDM